MTWAIAAYKLRFSRPSASFQRAYRVCYSYCHMTGQCTRVTHLIEVYFLIFFESLKGDGSPTGPAACACRPDDQTMQFFLDSCASS